MSDLYDLKLPDHCWKPKYGNDSRRWYYNYEGFFGPSPKPASAMKQEYLPPLVHAQTRTDIPVRRGLIKEKAIAEAIAEIKRENSIQPDVEEYCTTYAAKFDVPGFTVHDVPPENEQLHLKHPLYKSIPITIYSEKLDEQPRDRTQLAGMTRIFNPLHPFRKYTTFTTPISERNEDPE